MRLQTPEIAWHETLPIYSCDLQHSFPTVIHSDTDKANRAPLTDLLLSEEADELRLNLTEPIWTRLATAGGDNVVRLWRVALDWISAGPEPKTRSVVQRTSQKDSDGNLQGSMGQHLSYLASLKRHEKPVNVVRWSPTANRMRLQTPEIAWHETLPIYSCDLQHSFPTVIHSDTDKANRAPLTDLLLSEEADELRLNLTEPIWTRLATAGGDNVVRLWRVALDWISAGPEPKTRSVVQRTSQKDSDGNLQGSMGQHLSYLASLKRHEKPVNVVRWSPTGYYLASAGDDLFIIIWCNQGSGGTATGNHSERRDDEEEEDGTISMEHWVPCRSLRRHLEDIYDVCWAPDSQALISGSVDHSLIVWQLDLPAAPKSTLPPTDEKSAKLTSSEDRPNGTVIAPPPTPSSGSGATKCLILRDHKHYVQGVTWDPLGFYVASLSSDRACRVYRAGTRTCLAHVAKAGKQRLFQDDSWKSFFRRLTFSPDGLLLACPSGNLEGAVFAGSVAAAASLATSGAVQPEPTNTLPLPVAAPQHAAHLFLRSNFTKPVVSLPTGPRPVVCVRFCPQPFQLRTTATLGSDCVEGTQHPNSLFDLPYRWLFCLVLEDGVLFYDTQQTSPFAQVSQFHYQALNDATWSADGHLVVVCSTDGYCSLIHFARGELGAAYRGPMGVKTDAMQPMGEPPSARMAESTDEVNTVPPTSVSHSTVSGELKNVEHSDVRPHTPEKPNDHSSIETSCAMDVSLHTSPSSPAKKRRIPLTTLSSDITPHALDLNNNSRSQTEHLSATTREQAVPPAEVKADIVMEHKMLTETSKSASYGQKRRVSFVTLDTVPTTLVTSSRNMDPPNSVQNDPTGGLDSSSSLNDAKST
ncbi:Chromatin assembly factor 1 subunit B [Clonorchis sinensis]|uniref:Chromatin assembly factor 1 subunit B n=1 Tax=Clonorchis sinensis TaxID=79923 RepID=A0A8T1M954_CLOSI|nr:Chromatin assembly factor 1 subunit B [Clonorchis sinensis]